MNNVSRTADRLRICVDIEAVNFILEVPAQEWLKMSLNERDDYCYEAAIELAKVKTAYEEPISP